MRVLLAALMAAHGLAHLVGFVGPWRLMDSAGVSVQRSILGGTVELGEGGIKALGLVWLALALAFLGAAGAAALDRSGWTTVAAWVTGASLVMCVVGWPAARIGVFVNLALLGALLAGARIGRL
jgi:hypothetical protein